MVPLSQITAFVRDVLSEWRSTRLAETTLAHRDTAVLALIALAGLAVGAAVVRSLRNPPPGRSHIALPALLRSVRSARLSFGRHLAVALFLLGIPFLAVALADPYTSFTSKEATFPGRRIALMIDASASMFALRATPGAKRPAPGQPPNAPFFATVEAGETFVRQRMIGRYRDLIAVIEFGNQAYVITPFTTDYNNVLLSLSLIGDITEAAHFPDAGTTIASVLQRGIDLFGAFDFLNASGNLMVLFTDGNDRDLMVNGTPVTDILSSAREHHIPVYMIRTNYNPSLSLSIPDEVWKTPIENTGGHFYPASDEATVLRAVREIDQLSGGTVVVKQYSSQQPRFAGFAGMAAALWTLAAALKLTLPHFQTFP